MNKPPEKLHWRKSVASTQESHCVEAAGDEAMAYARDSKVFDGPVLGFTADRWDRFLHALKQSPAHVESPPRTARRWAPAGFLGAEEG